MKITFNDTVAQLAHVAWGGWMPFLFARLLHTGYGVDLAVALALAKEASEALGIAPWEPKQTWLSSSVDFAFFALGTGITYALFILSY